jgi:hypothetical protein
VIVGDELKCYNVDLGCRQKSKQRKTPKGFTTYNSSVWKQYPKDVHACYKAYVSNLIIGYLETCYTTGFCDNLLFNQGAFQAFADQIEDALDFRCQSTAKVYYQFVKEQKSGKWKQTKQIDDTRYIEYLDMKWPVFDMDCPRDYFTTPDRKAIATSHLLCSL